MEQITIQIKNKRKAKALIEFLKSLDFVEHIDFTNISPQSNAGMKETDFFALAGIWSDRDITIDAIRSQAWPARV